MRDRLVTNTKGQELGQKVTKRWKLESSCPYRGHTPMLPSILHPHPSGRRGWNNNVDVPGPKQCSIHIANGNSLTSPTEKAMATHSRTLAGKSHGRRSLVGCSPWGLEESDMTERLHIHFSLLCIGEGNGNPFWCSCLENPRDGVTQSWTQLK